MVRSSFWNNYSFVGGWPAGHAGLAASLLAIIGLLALVELVLKGLALWRAAELKQPLWFVLLLVINTAGIFPLIYLLVTKPKN